MSNKKHFGFDSTFGHKNLNVTRNYESAKFFIQSKGSKKINLTII